METQDVGSFSACMRQPDKHGSDNLDHFPALGGVANPAVTRRAAVMGVKMRLLKRLFRRFIGYSDCPICHEQTIQWVKDPVLFEDEPPLFGHWQCLNPNCLVSTEMESTEWADEIAREHGYKTFKEALTAGAEAAK